MKCLALTLFVFATAVIAVADDHSFAGTWKENLEKSDFTGRTSTTAKMPSGMLHDSSGSIEFDYQIDGKDYEMVPGLTIAWTQSGENSWNTAIRKDGKVLAVGHISLSKDGNTKELTYTFYRLDGQTQNGSNTSQRVSGGPGLLGTWKETKAEFGLPWTHVIEMPARDEISTRSIEEKSSWRGKCDGSDVAPEGAREIKGNTGACRMLDARTIEWTYKLNGKVIGLSRWTLSADGRSLEHVSWTPGKDGEKTTLVLDRQ